VNTITTKTGRCYKRRAWTGGDKPDIDFGCEPEVAELIDAFLQEQIAKCGGLDLWECAGTSAAERKAIFQQRALPAAWRTLHP
jgi:hypothetical protein